MPNTQPREGRSLTASALLVHSVFPTVQGEGPRAGQPAVFVRLAGCNLQCAGCDTEYTRRDLLSFESLAQKIMQDMGANWNLLVITGGEPFRQGLALSNFITFFRSYWATVRPKSFPIVIQIETNGSLEPPIGFPITSVEVICSPKISIAATILKNAIAFKYVVSAGNGWATNGLPTRVLDSYSPQHVAVETPDRGEFYAPRYVSPSDIYIQPMDSGVPDQNEANLQEAVKVCLAYGYRLCLQVHKLVSLP